MKKIFLVLATAALFAVSCNKEGDDNTVKPLEATFELTTDVAALPYGQPAEILGTATTEATLDSYTLTAVKKVAEEYVAVGEAQVLLLNTLIKRNIDRTVGPLEVRFLVLDSSGVRAERIAPKTSSSVALCFDKPYSKSKKFTCQAPPWEMGRGGARQRR